MTAELAWGLGCAAWLAATAILMDPPWHRWGGHKGRWPARGRPSP
jgi:hypothetical protein